MKIFPAIIFGICLLMTVSCKEEPKGEPSMEPVAMEVSTFYFIRHAEKDRSNPGDPDPELSQKGLGRAMHWAEILNDVPLDAIYSTDYKRTEMTAAPTAVKQNLTVQYYDPGTMDAAAFKTENTGRNVLVVGHSNTTPDVINRLTGEDRFSMMDDDDNGSLFIVTMVGSQTSVSQLHFNCNCPD
ncbi:MAG: phosphoglycerate mutase family protein [Robiginitalea sp.]|jgi:broad specificity phosphatase PhoE